MYSLSITQLPVRASIKRPLKIDSIVLRILMWIIIVDAIIIPGVLIKLFFNPFNSLNLPFISSMKISDTTLGPATESFIQQLKTNNFNPIPTEKVSRRQFTVVGEVVTIGGDNIQIFEYPSHETALKEASILVQKYSVSTRSPEWKSRMHIYVKDTLVLYYIGNMNSIIGLLEQNAGLSLNTTAEPELATLKTSNL